MESKRIFPVVMGTIALISGLLCFCALILTDMPLGSGVHEMLLIIAIPNTLCGLFGIAGGVMLMKDTRIARALLLVAAIAGIPVGLIFFVLFMVARNRALPQWPEEESEEQAGEE